MPEGDVAVSRSHQRRIAVQRRIAARERGHRRASLVTRAAGLTGVGLAAVFGVAFASHPPAGNTTPQGTAQTSVAPAPSSGSPAPQGSGGQDSTGAQVPTPSLQPPQQPPAAGGSSGYTNLGGYGGAVSSGGS